jgi:cytochrome c
MGVAGHVARHGTAQWAAAALMLAATALVAGCHGGKQRPAYAMPTAGAAQQGRRVIVKYRCGSCHMIPGIPGAHGTFGPPLKMMGLRTYIAGEFPNDSENMMRWIEAPTALKPKTTMPDLGLSRQEAMNAAAYLETLR